MLGGMGRRSLRTVFGVTSILIWLGGSVRAQIAPSPPPPPPPSRPQAEPRLEISGAVSSFVNPNAVPGPERAEVVVSPANPGLHRKTNGKPAVATSWRCVLVEVGQISKDACADTTGWMTAGPGLYTVSVSTWPTGGGRPELHRLPLTVTGGERTVSAFLSFGPMGACAGLPLTHPRARRMQLESFSLERILPAPAELVMRRSWEPSSQGKPVYEIENRGQQTWHSTGRTFAGTVLAPSGRDWRHLHRGTGCASVEPDSPLTPARRVTSAEGYFKQPPAPFLPGHYRYQVQLTLDQSESGESCFKGTPQFTTQTTYVLIDEFRIDA